MRHLVALAPFAVLIALLASCGGDDKPIAAVPPAFPGETWQLEYNTSGGIAGFNQRLTLDEKGMATLEDKRLNRTRDASVDPSDVAVIHAMMRAANLPSVKSDQGLPVPDGIVTSLKVSSGGKSYGGTFTTLPSSPELVVLLRRLAFLYEANKP